jgi:hypothetical protein
MMVLLDERRGYERCIRRVVVWVELPSVEKSLTTCIAVQLCLFGSLVRSEYALQFTYIDLRFRLVRYLRITMGKVAGNTESDSKGEQAHRHECNQER